jgi:REP element-mobilizing transposase RayT
MARPLRIQGPGLTYHITARGVRRTRIYLDDEDRRRFLTLLADVVERYALICHTYCEMTNHFHLAVTTTEANLSRAVQQLDGDYARWWNWRHARVGHVFEARFGSQLVQDNSYLVNVCRYIVLNPVRAGMVESPEQWPWSSYGAMIGLVERPSFLNCTRVLDIIDPDNHAAAVERFRGMVMESGADAPKLPSDAILGDDAFVARFREHRARASREVPRRRLGRPGLDAIFQGAATRSLRNAAIATALEERYAIAEIARYLGLARPTVSKLRRRLVPESEKSNDPRPDPKLT